MEFENLLTLIKTVSDSELTDFDYEENGTRIRLKKKKETVVVSGTSSNVPVMGLQTVQPLGQITESEAKMEKDIADGEPEGMLIKSPLVGTFYAAPAEDADPFVSVGDQVKKGQTLAIVEAMKLMNEIESDFDGKVAEIYVERTGSRVWTAVVPDCINSGYKPEKMWIIRMYREINVDKRSFHCRSIDYE